MAKLAIATVVLVALFLAVAEVSCFRTIVTTTIEEENRQGRDERQEQRCRQQVQQRYGQLQSCRSYLQPRGSPFELDMVANQQRQRGQEEQQQQQQRQCCQPLRELGDCSCQAIQQIVEEQVQRLQQGRQQRQGQWGQQGQQQQVQEILERARDLPRECGLRQQCEIQTPSYYYY